MNKEKLEQYFTKRFAIPKETIKAISAHIMDYYGKYKIKRIIYIKKTDTLYIYVSDADFEYATYAMRYFIHQFVSQCNACGKFTNITHTHVYSQRKGRNVYLAYCPDCGTEELVKAMRKYDAGSEFNDTFYPDTYKK